MMYMMSSQAYQYQFKENFEKVNLSEHERQINDVTETTWIVTETTRRWGVPLCS
jgi:hypothetical protein